MIYLNQMRLSHIKIQQTLLTINGKNNIEEIEKQIQIRSNGLIDQISVFNSTFHHHVLPICNSRIEICSIKRCHFIQRYPIEIVGQSLKVVELQNCLIKQLPIIKSDVLQKLNVSHNQIEQILSIGNRSLKLLDIRDNRIRHITRQIYCIPALVILHQFFTQSKGNESRPSKDCLMKIQDIIKQQIYDWSNSKLIQICQQIIDCDNDVLFQQIFPYLNQQFISKIFQIAKTKRKHKIIELLIKEQLCDPLTFQQNVSLLIPQFITKDFLQKVTLEILIKTLSTYTNNRKRVQNFLQKFQEVSNNHNYLIQSEKDLINYMNLNINHSNNYQVQLLLTQIHFFKDYDFGNRSVIKYLLFFNNFTLTKYLLNIQLFQTVIFTTGIYREMLKSTKKTYKLLKKADKLYQKRYICQNQWCYPQYRQRKSFCLKNDLYDYNILKQYEEIQCSYLRKDFKYTLKFYNKQNQISIAKKIENQLRKQSFKSMKSNKSQYSTNSSINE